MAKKHSSTGRKHIFSRVCDEQRGRTALVRFFSRYYIAHVIKFCYHNKISLFFIGFSGVLYMCTRYSGVLVICQVYIKKMYIKSLDNIMR